MDNGIVLSEEMKEWQDAAKEIIPMKEHAATLAIGKLGKIDETVEALTQSPIGNAIGYNELEAAPYVRGALPWTGKHEVRPWADSDDSYLLAYAETNWGVKSDPSLFLVGKPTP